MQTNIENILSVYNQATPDERRHGQDWYFEAHRICRKMAYRYAVPISTVAGVVAALSPNQRWSANIEAAERVIDAFKRGLGPDDVRVSTYNLNKTKAFQLLAGAPRKDVLRGPKVNEFFRNIIAPWRSKSVTVDGHAYSIWRGERLTLKSRQSKFGIKTYRAVSEDYRQAAAGVGLQPWQLQAITWVAWRRLHRVETSEVQSYS